MVRFEDPTTGHGSYWYDGSDVAKFLMIKHEKKYIGRNKLLQLLRFNKILVKHSNQPTQYWINLGLARYHYTTKRYKTYGMVLFSEKGLNRLKVMLENNELQIGFEKISHKLYVSVNDVM